ncbi:glycosyltransferase family 9 protein [Phenylobacterium sp. J367]|uniref:glycosyltransferase family 9 protein n=1 Tax=Phenylobacterium sp. J367 TaxID=2898435 RepID=UPI002150DE1F|nr:glycosyltransferase family 9 protein [Phenylobacterium sp. J367]MCR5877428.1 glycosyltransferase family 9 protein [Phenylobacterium sp. J367]
MARGSFPILFITATRIGDAVLSSGLVKRLSDEIPGARFTIVAGPAAAPLFADVPNLDRLIVFEKAKDGSHWFDLWRQVRGRRWGLIVDLRGSAISSFLRRRRRAVFRKVPGETVHKVIEASRALKIEDQPAAPYLFTSEATEALAAEITQGFGPILAIAPAANWVGKTWPVERFSQVAMRLLGPNGPMRGGRLMILGGPEDAKVAAQLKDVVMRKQLIDLTGRTDLLTSFAALKHARLYIGNDSGTTHLAAAAGVPTLALFGPSDERLYAPWGEHTRVVRGPRTFDQVRNADPTLSQQVCHMMDLTVDTVAKAAEALLAATEPTRRETKHG